MSRTILIGDIHGCAAEFEDLLAKLAVGVSDRVILLGDLVNRGPDSGRVVRLARAKGFEVLLGNHEYALLQYAQKSFAESGKQSSRPVFDALTEELNLASPDWLKWMDKLPAFVETQDFIAVHGGIVPGEHPANSVRRDILTIRTWNQKKHTHGDEHDTPWHDLYTGKKLVVYGHWAAQGLKMKENSIGLDTGCVYGRALSAVILPERTIVQIRACRAYMKF